MVLETSMQARFLIPMAISIAFGIIFATFIILLLVPAIYLAIEDGIGLGSWLTREEKDADEGPEPTEPSMSGVSP